MANSTQVREQLGVFLQRKIASRVTNTLFSVMPVLEFMLAINAGKKSGPAAFGLGRPDSGGLMIGRINEASRPRREKVQAEREYLPVIQITKPSKSDVKIMSDYDNDPTVPNWDSTNAPMKRFVQPRFKFARKKMPYKIPHTDIRTASESGANEGGAAARAVGSVYDVEVKNRTAVLCEVLNDCLFGINGQTGFPVNEDATMWTNFHALTKALGTTNTYAGLDRTVTANAFWKGPDKSAQFTGDFEALIEDADYEVGMIAKGLGVGIIAVGKTLMRKAKAEARLKSYKLESNGLPEYPEFGFKRDIVRIASGNRVVYVVYDPAIDQLDTETAKYNAFALDPSTWTVCIHKDGNFKVSTPSDQTKVEGGDEADTGTIAVEMMIACEVPSGNAWYQDIAA